MQLLRSCRGVHTYVQGFVGKTVTYVDQMNTYTLMIDRRLVGFSLTMVEQHRTQGMMDESRVGAGLVVHPQQRVAHICFGSKTPQMGHAPCFVTTHPLS